MSCCDIFEKFQVNDLLIKEYKYWTLSVKPNQFYLGSCLAITKAHHEALGELSQDEMSEYQQVAKDIENATAKVFSNDGIHHAMLMKYDRHTHFHVVPRYIEARESFGEKWEDGFGGFTPGQKREVSKEFLIKLRDKIKEAIQ